LSKLNIKVIRVSTIFNFTNSTSWIHDFNFTNSRFQLHEFTISTSWIHEWVHDFNFMNSTILTSWIQPFQLHEFTILASWIHDFYFKYSRFQLHEYTISTSWIHDYNLNVYFTWPWRNLSPYWIANEVAGNGYSRKILSFYNIHGNKFSIWAMYIL
jgi:hypothetical protein